MWVGPNDARCKKRLERERPWLIVAHKLGMSLKRCKAETTPADLALWLAFFQEEPNHFNALHYYLAQICQVLAQVNSAKQSDANRITTNQFLLKFNTESEKKELTDEEKQAKIANSKNFWKLLTGTKTGKTARPLPAKVVQATAKKLGTNYLDIVQQGPPPAKRKKGRNGRSRT